MHHERPVIDVGAAVIRRDGRYLICRRRPEDSSGGLWEFPGGKREAGETLEACVQREIREELGCRIVTDRFLTAVDTAYGERLFRVHFYMATLTEGEPRPLECAELAWVAPLELAAYTFLAANRALLPLLIL